MMLLFNMDAKIYKNFCDAKNSLPCTEIMPSARFGKRHIMKICIWIEMRQTLLLVRRIKILEKRRRIFAIILRGEEPLEFYPCILLRI